MSDVEPPLKGKYISFSSIDLTTPKTIRCDYTSDPFNDYVHRFWLVRRVKKKQDEAGDN